MSDDGPSIPAGLDRRPPGVGDDVVEAMGRYDEALEWIERARGRLYDFHQMMGHADAIFRDAADLLEQAGHPDLAQRVRHDIVGRNVLPGRWTFQVVEEFDDGYWEPVRAVGADLRSRLVEGRRHVHEAELKAGEITPGAPTQEPTPPE